MATEIHVEGYEAFMKAVEDNKGKEIYALFCGSLGSDGKSWCPDCVVAEPVVKECMGSLPEGSVFIHCGVGERAFWKDQGNIFRKDNQLKLKGVPTLLKFGSSQRLVEDQCAKKDLVTMLFEEE